MEKRSFLETIGDIETKHQRIFIEEDGIPIDNPLKINVNDWRDYKDQLMIIIQEKTIYAHNDRSVRPILLVKTEGRFGYETEFENIWLAFLDVEEMKLVHKRRLNFKFPPALASCYSAPEIFGICMSSPMTYSQNKDEITYRQNY